MFKQIKRWQCIHRKNSNDVRSAYRKRAQKLPARVRRLISKRLRSAKSRGDLYTFPYATILSPSGWIVKL